ncbi:MAG: LacI family DNA-binding transcriptional regulator [Hyphomicrobiales bacterium]
MRTLTNKRPTIADVARQANVSTATVSRALQTPDLVSESTRKVVFDVVAQTGYRVNTAAKMLRQNRSGTLLVILPDIANPFFSEILSGIEDAATEQNHTILIGNTNGQDFRARDLLENLRNGRADGALLLNGNLPLPPEEISTLSLISISENIPGIDISHVGTDNVRASADATQHLIDLGHKRIIHFCGPEGNVLSVQRMKGYETAMQSAGLQDEIRYFPCGFTIDAGQNSARQMLSQEIAPTAIVCANDAAAMGTIAALQDQGISVPENISVIGFDDIAFASIFSPPLTTISQQRKEIGRQATYLLLDLIKELPHQTKNVVVEHSLVQRASTAAPKSRKPNPITFPS